MSETVSIPQLRFPEFSGAWNTHSIGKIGTFFSGGTPTSSNKDYYSGTIPFIGSGKISSESVKQHITQEALDSSSAKIVNEGDLLYALYGATSGAVALSKINGAINQAVLCIRTNENKFFLKTWLEKNKERILGTYLQGGQGNLSAQIVKSLKLNLPTKPEQQKIAAFLTEVDTKIEQLSKKQALLGEYKKGLMQQIFSQVIRFKADDGSEFPDWEEKKLGDVCSKARSGGTPRSTTKEYYDGDIPFLAISDITKQGKYLTSASKKISQLGIDNSASWVVPIDTIIYSMYASVGFVSINKIPLATSQAVINLIVKDGYSIEFIYYHLIEIKKTIHKFIETGTQGNLNAQTVKSLILNIPSLPEQAKIANFLSSIDNKIEQVGKQLDESKQFKKALLQQMFV